MGLGFLAPLFLAGLAAIGIPLALHLAQRERKDVVPFPSLMFLRRVPHRAERRRRLRHLLLLAMRCLALALVAAAFARPLLERRGAPRAAAGSGARELVVLLDRSWSMGYGDRWARARAAAGRAVSGVGSADRATIVLFDATAVAATEPTADAARLRSAIDSARPSALGTRYAPALRLAAQILRDSDRPRREVVLVTDFQRRGWDARDDAHLPPGATLTRVDVAADERETSDVAVAGVQLGRSGEGGRERVTASARLVNTGAAPARDVSVTLAFDGREAGTRAVTIPARGAATVAFDAVAIPDGVARGTLRAARAGATALDPLALDDVFHFTTRRGAALSVLVVDHPAAPDRASLYLRDALALGGDPPFAAERARAGSVTAAALDAARVVVWNDAGEPSSDVARRLAAFVRRGGGLVVALGDRTPGRWSGDAAALLPGTAGEVADRSADRGGSVGTLDRAHPVFAPFAAPRSGDWGAPRFFRYRPITTSAGSATLARWDDGGGALAERVAGEGRVLAWGSALDASWSDLPLHPVYLPFVHQLVKHAAGFARERDARTVGDVVEVPRSARAAGIELVAVAPSGRRHRVASDSGARATPRAPGIELTEPGFWELRRADGVGAPLAVLAANPDLAESDLTRLDPEELAIAVAPAVGDSTRARLAEAALTPAERERRQAAWWWLLAGALLLLVAETVISNRWRAAGTRAVGAARGGGARADGAAANGGRSSRSRVAAAR